MTKTGGKLGEEDPSFPADARLKLHIQEPLVRHMHHSGLRITATILTNHLDYPHRTMRDPRIIIRSTCVLHPI